MRDLLAGVGHFMGTVHAKERELFERLSHAQSPGALFVACSDSRVDPSLITQTDPGEIFVLRNAGNLIPSPQTHGGGEAATIEYAVEILEVPDIIICGHSDCGAMKALLHPEKLLALPNVARWLEHASPTRGLVDKDFPGASAEVRWLAAVEINVLVQIEHLRLHPFARRAIEAGRLAVHAWVYDIGSGEIRAFDGESHCFERIHEGTRALEGSPAGTPAEWPF